MYTPNSSQARKLKVLKLIHESNVNINYLNNVLQNCKFIVGKFNEIQNKLNNKENKDNMIREITENDTYSDMFYFMLIDRQFTPDNWSLNHRSNYIPL